MTNISHATGIELFYIGLTIITGASLLNFVICHFKKQFTKLSTNKPLHTHGLCWTEDSPEKLPGYEHFDEKAANFPTLPASLRHESRGLLSHLPSRTVQPSKTSWSIEEKRQSLNQLLVLSHEQNQRSTYLGHKTYSSTNPASQIFGWHKSQHQSTIFLGEVASIHQMRNEVYLRFMLHPEDAEIVCKSGWGYQVPKSVWERMTTVSGKRTRCVEVLVHAAGNESELMQITRIVLNASIWWSAGLDEEEEV